MEASDKSASKRSNPMAQLLAWSGPNKRLYALSVVLACVGVAGSIVPYYAAGRMLAGVLEGVRDLSFYVPWLAVAACSYAVYIVAHHASTAISHKATFNTISRIRRLVAAKLTRVPLGYVLDTPSGRLKNVLVERVDAVETPLAHMVPEMTSNMLIPLFVVVYLLTLDWRLALVSLITIPLGLLAYAQMGRDYAMWYGRTVKAGNEMASASVEYVNGIEVIKAFGRSASNYEKFSKAVRAYAHSFIDWMAHVQIWQDLGLAIAPATLVFVLPVGSLLVIGGTLDASTFVLMAVLSLSIFPPLYSAISFIDSLAQVGTVVGEISDVLSQPEQRRAEHAAQLACAPGGSPEIVLKEVRFSYAAPSEAAGTPDSSTAEASEADVLDVKSHAPSESEDAGARSAEVIHGVSLRIAPGQVTALVGPSGSGKSTLARLIAGFWDPDSGEVLIGGVPTTSCSSKQLCDLIAYVAQDNYLFDDTVMENIRMGRPSATDEEVVQAAKDSGCHDFIMGLENGYQTVVGGSGGHLSGGERQRVAIARAMLKDAPLVILDEATAYTDPESEAEIESAVSRLVAGRTLIVIAHRLSTITDADQIVLVDDGRIAATGTHDELLARSSLYARMYEAHMGARDEATLDSKEGTVA